ncbi:MAG TPA: hypothetical protein VFO82_05855 [Steroidobacteraceae bacterium]|nr:hypothetical protein [Steroidobacteraceae bacterium]
MKPHDRPSLEEQASLVSRYVAGDLSRSERAAFEAWLVASPELAAEVEMERRLRRGIASAARRGWLNRSAQSRTLGSERRWHMAAAASVVVSLFVVGATLVMPSPDSSDSRPAADSSAIPSSSASPRIVRLGLVRSLGTIPDVTLARNATPSQLTIEPDVVVFTCADGNIELECAGGMAPQTPQYSEYELELVNRRDSTLAWRSTRQLPTSGSVLSFVMHDPASLAVGDYDMVVRGHSPEHEEVVARFWLRVTAQ